MAPQLGCKPSHTRLLSAPPRPRCSLRGIEAKQARFGLVECLNHGLLNAYPVTYEKDGDLVAHVSAGLLSFGGHLGWAGGGGEG